MSSNSSLRSYSIQAFGSITETTRNPYFLTLSRDLLFQVWWFDILNHGICLLNYNTNRREDQFINLQLLNIYNPVIDTLNSILNRICQGTIFIGWFRSAQIAVGKPHLLPPNCVAWNFTSCESPVLRMVLSESIQRRPSVAPSESRIDILIRLQILDFLFDVLIRSPEQEHYYWFSLYILLIWWNFKRPESLFTWNRLWVPGFTWSVVIMSGRISFKTTDYLCALIQ